MALLPLDQKMIWIFNRTTGQRRQISEQDWIDHRNEPVYEGFERENAGESDP